MQYFVNCASLLCNVKCVLFHSGIYLSMTHYPRASQENNSVYLSPYPSHFLPISLSPPLSLTLDRMYIHVYVRVCAMLHQHMPRLYCIQGGSYIFSWVKCLHIIFSSILFSLHFFFSAPCLSCSLHTVQPTENVTNTIDCSYFSGAIHGMLVQCLSFCLHFPRFYSCNGCSKVVQKIFVFVFLRSKLKKNSTTTLLI